MGNYLPKIPFITRRQANDETEEVDEVSELFTESGDQKSSKKAKTTSGEYSLQDNLTFTIQLKTKEIMMDKNKQQIIPGLISITAGDFDAERVASDKVNYQSLDLIFVLDVSGSMQGAKIEQLKKSTLQILNFMKQADRACIITFHSEAQIVSELIPVTKSNLKNLEFIVNNIQAGGGTYIGGGMREAFNVIKKRKNKSELTSVFLLSDGQDSTGFNNTRQYLKEANIKDPFCIDCFGFGADHDPVILTQINKLQQGTFNFIRDISQIEDAFTIIFAGIKTFIAQDLKLNISFGNTGIMNGVSVIKTYGENWQKLSHNKYQISINNLMAGRSKEFVFELSFPPFEMELSDEQKYQKIITASLEARCLYTKSKYKAQTDLTVELTNKPKSKKALKKNQQKQLQIEEKKVMEHYYRVLVADAIEQALKLADSGKFDESQQILKDIEEKIKKSEFSGSVFVQNLLGDLKNSKESCQQRNYGAFGRGYMMNCQQINSHQTVGCNFDSKVTNGAYIFAEQNRGQERFRSLARQQYKQ